MNILVVGNGGREHALAWKLAQSPRTDKLFVAPGNGGTRQIAENLDVSATDIDGLVAAVKKHGIDLTVVGPEAPLAEGIVGPVRGAGVAGFRADRGRGSAGVVQDIRQGSDETGRGTMREGEGVRFCGGGTWLFG